MKKIFLFCFLMLYLCCGCSTTSKLTKDEYDEFNDYINIIGEKCITYIENDSSISPREKNVYKTRHRLIKEQMQELKVK